MNIETIAQSLGLAVEQFDGFLSISALVEGEDGWSRECGVDYYDDDGFIDWQDGNGLLSNGSGAQCAAVRELARQWQTVLHVAARCR